MERNLAMELVRVTEAAALGSARLMGRGDETAADMAAVEAMRNAIDVLPIAGTVVIGEGDHDAMPMLYVSERVGTGQGPELDVACDALEGAAICATGGGNAPSPRPPPPPADRPPPPRRHSGKDPRVPA